MAPRSQALGYCKRFPPRSRRDRGGSLAWRPTTPRSQTAHTGSTVRTDTRPSRNQLCCSLICMSCSELKTHADCWYDLTGFHSNKLKMAYRLESLWLMKSSSVCHKCVTRPYQGLCPVVHIHTGNTIIIHCVPFNCRPLWEWVFSHIQPTQFLNYAVLYPCFYCRS